MHVHTLTHTPTYTYTHTRHKGQDKLFRQPKVGSEMQAKVVRTQVYDRYDDAVVVEVTGHAYYSGRAEFWLEEGDRLAEGFLVK